MNIGIIGFGNVSKELIKLVLKNNYNFNIKYVIKSDGGITIQDNSELINLDDLKKHKSFNNKLSYKDVIDDESIDLLIELTSTNIETGEPALTHIKSAICKNKHVVTGNKGAIIHGYKEINELSIHNKVKLGIGCTVGGALPSYIVGKDGLAGSEIISIEGILNGTSNYILELMHNENLSFEEGLIKAQNLGIAEKNPKLDIEGFDTASKMLILVNTLLNKDISINDINIEGIQNIKLGDIENAKRVDKVLKLVGEYNIKENKIIVSPKLIDRNSILYSIKNKNKGVVFYTDILGEIFLAGGESSTIGAAASILRDIININSHDNMPTK
ncbi:MAG: homoserine dehydrogenase [Clostridium sp.]